MIMRSTRSNLLWAETAWFRHSATRAGEEEVPGRGTASGSWGRRSRTLSSGTALAREEGSSEALADTRRGGASRTMRAEKIFKLAKGFRGRAKNTIRAARNRVEKALQYAYRDRKAKKREFRELWIQQINAATREHGVKYSEFMHGLKEENVVVDRKILAELARTEPYSFKALVDQVKRMKGIE